MTTFTKDEAAATQMVEHQRPQAGPDGQSLHPDSDKSRSREEFMAKVAESKARIKAMSPEERKALLDLGEPADGVSPYIAMQILDELEEARDSDRDEDVEAEESGGAREEKSKAIGDEQIGQDKSALEAGGAQPVKQKAKIQKQESKNLPASRS